MEEYKPSRAAKLLAVSERIKIKQEEELKNDYRGKLSICPKSSNKLDDTEVIVKVEFTNPAAGYYEGGNPIGKRHYRIRDGGMPVFPCI